MDERNSDGGSTPRRRDWLKDVEEPVGSVKDPSGYSLIEHDQEDLGKLFYGFRLPNVFLTTSNGMLLAQKSLKFDRYRSEQKIDSKICSGRY